MKIRDRIKELRREPANQLRPNPRNWRTHPAQQRNVLRELLADVGYANALLARELADGSLELIDGHLRAETTPDAAVPVLVLDVNEEEAYKILLTADPLAEMAESAKEELNVLIQEVEMQGESAREMVKELLQKSKHPACEQRGLSPESDEPDSSIRFEGVNSSAQANKGIRIPVCYQVVVECHNEDDQRSVYEQMKEAGYCCRALTL